MNISNTDLSRRALWYCASAVALAGCSANSGKAATLTSPPAATGSSSPSSSAAVSSARATASQSLADTQRAVAALPTRAAMVAKYQGKPAHGWGWNVPGVMNSMPKGTRGVALTFDACGGPGTSLGYDAKLIALLRKHKVKATLNLNLRWINANPSITKELIADPLFDIQSHGKRHLPLSINGKSAYGTKGTKNVGEIYDELVGEDDWFLHNLKRRPRFMRPGTAFVDSVAAAMARDLHRPIMGFSVNGDAGTTFSVSQIVTSLLPVRNGDIVISHMNHPEHQTAEGYAAVLPRLLDRGVRFIHLPNLI